MICAGSTAKEMNEARGLAAPGNALRNMRVTAKGLASMRPGKSRRARRRDAMGKYTQSFNEAAEFNTSQEAATCKRITS